MNLILWVTLGFQCRLGWEKAGSEIVENIQDLGSFR